MPVDVAPSGGGTVLLIMLQGEWLCSSGFDIGDEVLVTVERNRLTIDFEKGNGIIPFIDRSPNFQGSGFLFKKIPIIRQQTK